MTTEAGEMDLTTARSTHDELKRYEMDMARVCAHMHEQDSKHTPHTHTFVFIHSPAKPTKSAVMTLGSMHKTCRMK